MYKVKMCESFTLMTCDVWLYSVAGDVVYVLDADGQTMKENKMGEQMPPTLTIPTRFLAPLMDALKEMGVKSKEQSFTEGELKAQTSHLKDLRRLLKLPE